MMEVWLELTCDGCGVISNTEHPNMTHKEFMDDMKTYGWRQYTGGIHYCRQCHENGTAKAKKTIWQELE